MIKKALPPLLFHGTAEQFDLPPEPGGYDDVFWTAETSTIAQTYIPDSGLKVLLGWVSPYQIDQGVRPGQHSPWYDLVRQMGWEATDVTYDRLGSASSWRMPKGYPTYADVLRYLQNDLGYPVSREHEGCWLKATLHNGIQRIEEANHLAPGRLIIVSGHHHLRIQDLTNRGNDLTNPQYHCLDSFRAAAKAGYDGIRIDDYCQTKTWGNVGHESIGLFESALAKLQFESVPAVHYEWPADVAGLSRKDSPEFLAWNRVQEARQIMSSQQFLLEHRHAR